MAVYNYATRYSNKIDALLLRERVVRNRGYRFIIRELGVEQGFCALCINSTWINRLLEENDIDLRLFRKLTWEDLQQAVVSETAKTAVGEMKPFGFWQMCDAISVEYASYNIQGKVYRQPWFRKYPILVLEDIYEILLDEGYGNQEALEVMQYFEEECGRDDKRALRDILELYDVPPSLSAVLMRCRWLPRREEMMGELMSCLKKASALVG